MKWEPKNISGVIEDMLEPHCCYEEGQQLHKAAKAGILDKLPKEAFTPEGLMEQSPPDSETPLHFAAVHNQLKYIPKELFTEQNLMIRNRIGTTPMHLAAAGGCLHQIPNKFLTDTLLKIENYIGQSCLSHAITRLGQKETAPKSEIPLILSKLSDTSLKYYLKQDPDTKLISSMIKQELLKRKIVKELSSKEQSIEI